MLSLPGPDPIGYPVGKLSNTSMKTFLSSTNFKRHPCRDYESIPPRTEIPHNFHVTNLTTSSVMSTGIKIGVLSYAFNIEQAGFFCEYVSSRTDVAV